jgi:hypothetical protein
MRKEKYDGIATVNGGPDGPRYGEIQGILSPPRSCCSRREPETASIDDQHGGEFTLFLAPRSIQSEQTASGERIENYRVLFEYYVKSQAAVEAKYAELIGFQPARFADDIKEVEYEKIR